MQVSETEFADAYVSYKNWVVAKLAMTYSTYDVEDFAQDGWLTAWEKYSEFRGDAKLHSWVLSMAKNHHNNWLQHNTVVKEKSDDVKLEILNRPSTDPLSGTYWSELLEYCTRNQRDMLTERYVNGLTAEEIASKYGYHRVTVQSRIAEGLARIKRSITMIPFDPDKPSETGRGGPRADCPACVAKRCHTEEEWELHPYGGHGYTKETGLTHPVIGCSNNELTSPKKTSP